MERDLVAEIFKRFDGVVVIDVEPEEVAVSRAEVIGPQFVIELFPFDPTISHDDRFIRDTHAWNIRELAVHFANTSFGQHDLEGAGFPTIFV